MRANSVAEHQPPVATAIHLPSLLLALAIMLVGTVYPFLFTRSDGRVDHALATALFWSMSTGMVRGVGYVPRALWWRIIFSGSSCVAGLTLAAWLRFG